jgi:hypothetical protein
MAINRVAVGLSNSYGSWTITDYVLNLDISVGKNDFLDTFEPGTLSVTLKNFNREFDPTYTSSSFYNSSIPKITDVTVVLAGSYRIFTGTVDNWIFNYSSNGESTATFSATEYSSIFVHQKLLSTSFPTELSGARVSRVLSDAGVAYSTAVGATAIATGTQMLDADSAPTGKNAFSYLQSIEKSEQGQFYYDSDGTAVVSYPYTSIDVSYSSDLLYNQITVNSADGTNSVEVNDLNSQSTYSTYEYSVDDILYADVTKLTNLGYLLLAKYKIPRYSFSSLTVNFGGLPTATQDRLAFQLNSVNTFAKVRFTPNRIGSAVERYVRIIGIEHSVSPGSHEIKYMFENIAVQYLVLNDSEFGQLDYYSLGL